MYRSDYDLAKNYAPVLCLDSREPFSVNRVFYTVFRWSGDSPSFSRRIEFRDGEELAIEYAISWDFDIGHAYELEHVWVFVKRDGTVARTEATAHGSVQSCDFEEQPRLLVEAGKHGMADTEDGLLRRAVQTRLCAKWAGIRGAFVPQRFQASWVTPSVEEWLDTEGYLQGKAFEPAFVWDQREMPLGSADLAPWDSTAPSWLLAASRQAIQLASGSPWRHRRVVGLEGSDTALSAADVLDVRATEIDTILLDFKASWAQLGTELMVSSEGGDDFERILSAITFMYRLGRQNALTLWLDADALESVRPVLDKCYEVRLGFIGSSSDAFKVKDTLPSHSGFFWVRESLAASTATVLGHPEAPVFQWV